MRLSEKPLSPQEGDSGVEPTESRQEIRRARFAVQVIYPAAPGEFVDIEAVVRDALHDALGNTMGTAIIGLDMTEHVKLQEGADVT